MDVGNYIFRSLPACYLVLEPSEGFKILDVTNMYLRVSGTDRSIIGRPLFEVFPENPEDLSAESIRKLTASLEKVIATREPHRMAVQRYDVRNPQNGKFELRYWYPMNVPVLDDEGSVMCIIHMVEEVTDLELLKKKVKHYDHHTAQQVSAAIHSSRELQRMEISRELHDNINQILIAARMDLGRAIQNDDKDKYLLKSGYVLLEKAIEEIRHLSSALIETAEEDLSLQKSVDSLLQHLMSSGTVAIHKNIQLSGESSICPKVKTSVLRVVQEQVANIIKHSDAKNVYVSIEAHPDSLTLNIRDDGRGFQPSSSKNGIGFVNMKSRVALLDGTIKIDSKPGDGCAIHVMIPLRSHVI